MRPGNSNQKVRAIAFYLPQFHPVPENDEWWGKGFTEWRNVAKARPQFPGHYQPHIPADLGFYDLRLPEVREAQANLARQYGIHGFCYYHYDEVEHIRSLIAAFADRRYLRLHGRPLFLVYRTEVQSDPIKSTRTWR